MAEVSRATQQGPTRQKQQPFHPDGMAALIAVIVAGLDMDDLKDSGLSKQGMRQALQRAVDRRQNQVLEMARQYYNVNPVTFENEVGWMERLRTNSMNNRAKLDRANLWEQV